MVLQHSDLTPLVNIKKAELASIVFFIYKANKQSYHLGIIKQEGTANELEKISYSSYDGLIFPFSEKNGCLFAISEVVGNKELNLVPDTSKKNGITFYYYYSRDTIRK